MASGTLAVGGLMSGIDTESMFAQLREAYRKPIELMETRKSDYNVKLSAYSTLQAKLTALRTAAKTMDTSSEFASLSATSNDENVLTATTTTTAKDMTYNLQVKALAQTHKISSATTFNSADTLGAGDLTIQVGNNTARTITIASSDTIQDITDAINNDSSMDVVAATVYDGDKYRLMISAKEAGDENIVNITVDEGGTNDGNIDSSGLSQLVYDNMRTSSAAIADTFTATSNTDYITINGDFSVVVNADDTMQDIVDKINNSDYWCDAGTVNDMSDANVANITTIPKAVVVTNTSSGGGVFIRADGVSTWTTTLTSLQIDSTFMEENMYYQSNSSYDTTGDTTAEAKALVVNGTTQYTTVVGDNIENIRDGINGTTPGMATTITDTSDADNVYLRLFGISPDAADGSPNVNFNTIDLGLDTYTMHSKNMTRTQYSQDATVVVDGATIKRESNTIDDMLTGVTLNLKKTSWNSTDSAYDTVNLDVAKDTSGMFEKFEALAEAYNDLVDFFDEYQGVQVKEDASSKSLEDGMKELITILSGEELEKEDDSPIKYGPLMSDSTTSMVKKKLFNLSFADVSGVNSSYNNLTELGVTLTYGKMTIDKDTFTAAVSANSDAVTEFFTNDSSSSEGYAVQLIDAIDNMIENYASDQKGILVARQEGIQASIDRLDEQITSQDARINSIMDRTRAQFNSLEVLMGQYQTQSSYLANQLASMAG